MKQSGQGWGLLPSPNAEAADLNPAKCQCKPDREHHGRVAQRPERALYKRKGEGENPSAATTFLELKPQQTGTGLGGPAQAVR